MGGISIKSHPMVIRTCELLPGIHYPRKRKYATRIGKYLIKSRDLNLALRKVTQRKVTLMKSLTIKSTDNKKSNTVLFRDVKIRA